MADHDNQEDAPEVMLGFAEPVDLEEHGPLLAEQFVSKIGGLPVRTNTASLFLLSSFALPEHPYTLQY